jgi:hypothetical protein
MNQRPRRPQPRKSRPRRQPRKRITPAEARRRAAAHVLNRMFKGAKVTDSDKVRLGIYAAGSWKAAEVWIVYKNPDSAMSLKSSDIVVVAKRTGRVLYEGPAGDEG